MPHRRRNVRAPSPSMLPSSGFAPAPAVVGGPARGRRHRTDDDGRGGRGATRSRPRLGPASGDHHGRRAQLEPARRSAKAATSAAPRRARWSSPALSRSVAVVRPRDERCAQALGGRCVGLPRHPIISCSARPCPRHRPVNRRAKRLESPAARPCLREEDRAHSHRQQESISEKDVTMTVKAGLLR